MLTLLSLESRTYNVKSADKLKCLIVDDEPLAHDIILEYINEMDYLEVVHQCYRPLPAIEILKSEPIDLVFLDIQMPQLNGLEMLKLLDNKPQVIITSAYSEYALESYNLSVTDYLLKPFTLQRFVQATGKVRAIHQSTSKIITQNETLLIKSDKKLIQVNISDILYLESYGNYVKVHLPNQSILTPQTLTKLKEKLPTREFLKIHKSYIVHKSKVNFIEGNILHMINKDPLPISKNYKSEFLEEMKNGK